MQKGVVSFMKVQLDKCVPCKAPEELIAMLLDTKRSEAQRAEAAAALTDTPEAVSALSKIAKDEDEPSRLRDLALHSLIDTVLDRKHLVTEATVGTIVHALLRDRSESVRSTADAGLMVIASDFPEKALPLLRAAEKKEKGPAAERLASTMEVIFSLSSLREIAPNRGKPEPVKNIPPIANIKERREPPKLRAVA
jgi:HEAT repeat protein